MFQQRFVDFIHTCVHVFCFWHFYANTRNSDGWLKACWTFNVWWICGELFVKMIRHRIKLTWNKFCNNFENFEKKRKLDYSLDIWKRKRMRLISNDAISLIWWLKRVEFGIAFELRSVRSNVVYLTFVSAQICWVCACSVCVLNSCTRNIFSNHQNRCKITLTFS